MGASCSKQIGGGHAEDHLGIPVLLLVAVLIYAATKSDTFLLQRSIAITVPPEKVFPFVNDSHHWPLWLPWEKMDPAMKKTHSGSSQGLGAIYEGGQQSGRPRACGDFGIVAACKGRDQTGFLQTLRSAQPCRVHDGEQGETTNVTWAMSGLQLYVAKVMSLFFSTERMVGPQFESGLANFKALAEK